MSSLQKLERDTYWINTCRLLPGAVHILSADGRAGWAAMGRTAMHGRPATKIRERCVLDPVLAAVGR